jgi:hypothetical protein
LETQPKLNHCAGLDRHYNNFIQIVFRGNVTFATPSHLILTQYSSWHDCEGYSGHATLLLTRNAKGSVKHLRDHHQPRLIKLWSEEERGNTVEKIMLDCSTHCCKCILSSERDPCVATGHRVDLHGRPCCQRHSCSMNRALCILVGVGLEERRREL